MNFNLFCLLSAVSLTGAGAATSTAYSSAEQEALLSQHNTYRTGVSPGATNMNELAWDSGLATKAQTWTDKCLFYHPNTTIYTDYADLGQNLYIYYPDPTGTNPPSATAPVTNWWEEEEYYFYSYNACATDEVCGHYTQVVWAETTHIGCGITHCSTAVGNNGDYSNAWLVACQYSPKGNWYGEWPFESGSHCSQCSDGKYCENKLCSNCDPSDNDCECLIDCQNCGTKSSTGCGCSCPDGYYGDFCEHFCEDTHEYCGANPGWPTSWCGQGYWFVDQYCPKMCNMCTAGDVVSC